MQAFITQMFVIFSVPLTLYSTVHYTVKRDVMGIRFFHELKLLSLLLRLVEIPTLFYHCKNSNIQNLKWARFNIILKQFFSYYCTLNRSNISSKKDNEGKRWKEIIFVVKFLRKSEIVDLIKNLNANVLQKYHNF